MIWRTISAVTPDGWDQLRAELDTTYHRVSDKLRGTHDGNRANVVGVALAVLVHSAYHLGEIRPVLCCLW